MQHAVVYAGSALVLACILCALLHLLWDGGVDMASRSYLSLILASIATCLSAQNASGVDLGWYPPKKSWINSLDQVLNSTGTHGFVFNSSQLPAGVPYGTYNWCNMPHVRREEYVKAADEFELVYVEV